MSEVIISEEVMNMESRHETCPAVGYQSASVCVPVSVTPFAKPGKTITKCCGGPVVTPGRQTCCGVKNGSCTFTISQDICVAVPVEFGAKSEIGDPFVDCNGASAENICRCCDKDENICRCRDKDEDTIFVQRL